ncbi:signal recognition particle-docking protein FtsY [Glaciecola sp. KUL10]|uniref:signal recognition particle-docking protein FtsY n=1 Tax=Glaciecola sp. (strain KUL10) TaxID=2161813 RepID=UPI000D7860E5|nr:signal recognition particle-docking protein FtsY [Glaciecola sp. KUL10]GBL03826.1 signal recognition particle GTPase [Glaciecola sp. KUL10]
MSKLFKWFRNDAEKVNDEHTPTTPEEPVNSEKAVVDNLTQLDDEESLAVAPSMTDSAELIESVDTSIELADDVEVTTVEKTKVGFFSRLKQSLSRTKENIGSGFANLFVGKKIDDELYEDLETQLLVADVGIKTTSSIIDSLTENAKRKELKDGEALYELLKAKMRDILEPVSQPLDLNIATSEDESQHPFVILMVGVNGVGKTTTIGKLAKQFQQDGRKVMLAAGDTFRAAAVEQLQVWGERNDISVVAQQTGSDSASVIFDAMASAKAKGADVLIADTAGRLQNKDNLIEELKKVVRVMKKQNPLAPHEIMLTLDASTGQNAVSQTKIFNEAVGITGINLTKLDGTAKGGVIFSLADEFKIPVRYIGIGEGIDDLKPFDSNEFVEALFSSNEATPDEAN